MKVNARGAVIMTVLGILVVVIILLSFLTYCDAWGDKYSEGSWCFDADYKCAVDCEPYGGYEDAREGCFCRCKDVVVSICSDMVVPRAV